MKKVLSIVLVLCLVTALLPLQVLAEESTPEALANYILLDGTNVDYSVWTKPTNTASTPAVYAWKTANDYTSGNSNIKNSMSNLAIYCKTGGVIKFDWFVGSVNKFGYFAYRLNSDFNSGSDVTSATDNKYTGYTQGSEDGIQVSAGDILYFTFYKNNFDKHDTENGDLARIANLRIMKSGTVTLQSNDTGRGTVSTTAESLSNLPAGTVITVTATAVSGQFAGWYETIGETTRLISIASTLDYTVSEDVTLEGRFINAALNAVATFNDISYDDLQGALDAAASAGIDDAKVILVKSTSVNSLTIPNGVTLVVPYSADDEGTILDSMDMSPFPGFTTKTEPYRTLTVNGALEVNGNLLVNATSGTSDTGHQGSISGYYGNLVLNGNATVNNGGALYANGMVTGSGSIDAKSGGTVWQVFEMTDWPGGTAALNAYGNDHVFPINQYYIQRIQVDTTIEYGAAISAYAYAAIPTYNLAITVPMDGLIGTSDSAFFKVNSGSVTLSYNPDSYVTEVTIDGDVSIQSFSINAAGQSISTSDVVCPVPGSFAIDVTAGSTVNITSDIKILPGAELNVAEGATVNVAEGADIYIYGVDDFETISGEYRAVPSSSDADQVTPSTGAQVTIDGTLNNNGTIRTSSTEDGLLTINGETTGSGYVIPGAVGNVVIFFDGNGATETAMNPQVFVVGQAGQLNANTFVRDDYSFLGWSASAGTVYNPFAALMYDAGTTEYETVVATPVEDEMAFENVPDMGISEATFYAVWQENPYTVTFDSDGGSTIESRKVAEGGTVPQPDDPTKEGYVFAGWFYGDPALEFDFDTVINGDITLTAHWSEIAVTPTLTLEGNFVNSTGTTPTATITVTDASAGTFTVTCAKACVVAVDNGDGTYDRLTAGGTGNTRSFTAPDGFTSDISIVVAVKGDISLDGTINALDAGQVKAVSIGKVSVPPLKMLAADVNKDGVVNALDAGQVKAVSIGKVSFPW